MPLPGGPSDKISNRYEKRWTLYCLIQILIGKYDIVHLEPPEESKAEFTLLHKDVIHYHQAKRQLSKGNWTFRKLSSEGLIEAFGRNLHDQNIRWVFVSGYPAPILDELTENAQSANDIDDFLQNFVSSSQNKKNYFSQLQNNWNAQNTEVYKRLKKY